MKDMQTYKDLIASEFTDIDDSFTFHNHHFIRIYLQLYFSW